MEIKMKFSEVALLFGLSYDIVQKHAVKIRDFFPDFAPNNELNSEDLLYYSAFVLAYKSENSKTKKVNAGIEAYIYEVKKSIAKSHKINVNSFTLFGR
ncbi:MAG TPA: hypothetical protein DEB37_01365 [Lysinibacillus sp.]|nr:hypothetical protein [Lysinibacillus sp.]